MVYTRKNKTNIKKNKKPLRNKRVSLRKKRKTLNSKNKRRSLRKKRKTLRKKRKQYGGNDPLINSATWVSTTPSFLPPGGGYVNGCDSNGLGGGYYYDVQTCPVPLPQSTVDDPQNLSSIEKQQTGGGPYTSLGGLRGLFRQGVHSLKNVVSTYTTSDRPISPNPMKDQPIYTYFK
jgi:hypothetical protein